MYDTNQRVAITKRLLKEGLFRLLEKKPLEKINITELCRESGINRATFYRHYELPRDILVETETEFFEEMLKLFNNPLTPEDVERCYAYFLQNADMVKLFMQYASYADLSELFNALYQKLFDKMSVDLLDTENNQLIFAFLAGGGYFLLHQWLMGDSSKTPKEIADITFSIINKEKLLICKK